MGWIQACNNNDERDRDRVCKEKDEGCMDVIVMVIDSLRILKSRENILRQG